MRPGSSRSRFRHERWLESHGFAPLPFCRHSRRQSNRLTYTLAFTPNTIEQVIASKSTVGDTDITLESFYLARNGCLRLSAASVLSMPSLTINIVMGLLQFQSSR